MLFWLVTLAIIIILAALWFLRYRQRSRDWWDSRIIAWRRRQAVRLRIAQHAHNILTIYGKASRRDIDFVYDYSPADIRKSLGPKQQQDPAIFNYQGSFPLLNRSEKKYQYAPPLFTLSYEGGRAYRYFAEEARYDNSKNPYASTALFSPKEQEDKNEDASATILIVEAHYSAAHYSGDCIAIYVPLDENIYDSDEGLELVFICAWQHFHKERYERAKKLRMNAYAWRGDILLYFPGKWERFLPPISKSGLQLLDQKAYESSLIHQDSLRRRFLRQRERSKDEDG